MKVGCSAAFIYSSIRATRTSRESAAHSLALGERAFARNAFMRLRKHLLRPRTTAPCADHALLCVSCAPSRMVFRARRVPSHLGKLCAPRRSGAIEQGFAPVRRPRNSLMSFARRAHLIVLRRGAKTQPGAVMERIDGRESPSAGVPHSSALWHISRDCLAGPWGVGFGCHRCRPNSSIGRLAYASYCFPASTRRDTLRGIKQFSQRLHFIGEHRPHRAEPRSTQRCRAISRSPSWYRFSVSGVHAMLQQY